MIMRLQNKIKNKILILGGGGFLGKEAVYFFLKKKYQISVIDKNIKNLKEICNKNKHQLKLYKKDIISFKRIKEIIDQHNIIINCIGLNDHALGIRKPELDVKINISPILHVIKFFNNKKIIHIGTTHQYSGTMNKLKKFNETLATDVQGISKNAVESYLIFYAKKYKFKLICLRLGNGFGSFENNFLNNKGLVYEIIRNLLINKKFILYKKNIKKNFCYIPDAIKAINFLINKNIQSPAIYNFIQYNITVDSFIKKIIKFIEFGKITYSKKKLIQIILTSHKCAKEVFIKFFQIYEGKILISQ